MVSSLCRRKGRHPETLESSDTGVNRVTEESIFFHLICYQITFLLETTSVWVQVYNCASNYITPRNPFGECIKIRNERGNLVSVT